MPEQVTIASFEKVGRRFFLHFTDGSFMHWNDLDAMNMWIDRGSNKGGDVLLRGLLRRIRNTDPDFSNIGNISNVTYERPDVTEVV